jgi:hypothetical protein
MMAESLPGWSGNRLWSLPLIVTTVLLHCFGLVRIQQKTVTWFRHPVLKHHHHAAFVLAIGTAAWMIAALHGVEAGIWAIAYRGLEALPDAHRAMLYSLGAMTTYGHADIVLEPQWQMMGPLEALNGMILFGLSTAFLFSVVRELERMRSAGQPVRSVAPVIHTNRR